MLFRRQHRTLSSQLIIFSFFAMLLIFCAFILVSRVLIGKVMLNNARASIASLAREKVSQIERDMSTVQNQGQTLRDLLGGGYVTYGVPGDYVPRMFANNPDLHSVCIAPPPELEQPPLIYHNRPQGLTIESLPGTAYQYRDWYQIPSLTRRTYWSEPWYDRYGTQHLLVSYSLPLLRDGQIQGVIRLDMQLQKMKDIVQKIRVKKSGYATLLTSSGTIVSNPLDTLAMNYSIFDVAEESHQPELRELGKRMVNQETGFRKLPGLEGHPPRWLYYLPLPMNNWTLTITASHHEVFADLNRLTWILALAAICAYLVIAAMLYWRTFTLGKSVRPMVQALKQIGAGVFDSPLPHESKIYEISVLTESFNRMQKSLREYVQNIRTVTEEKNRILNEMLFAAEIQRNLVPKNADPANQFRQISAFGVLEPAGEIGGDLYDYFMLDPDHFCFAIADVEGKGIVAAMTMTMVTTLLRSVAPQERDPARILGAINTFLMDNNLKSNFVTIIVGIIDTRSGILSWSNAGHVPLYLVRAAGGTEKFGETHCTALGFLANLKISSDSQPLNPGDLVLLITDGITEAMNSGEQYFGTAGVETVLQSLTDAHPETAADAILTGVRAFSDRNKPQDDITILTLEYLGSKPSNR